jgi:hypothetical protein
MKNEEDIYESSQKDESSVKTSQNRPAKKESSVTKNKKKKKTRKKLKHKEKSIPMPQLAPPKYTPPPMPNDVEDLF